MHIAFCAFLPLQSARGVWRQSKDSLREKSGIPLQSARGVWRQRPLDISRGIWYKLQSARGVWRQRIVCIPLRAYCIVAICTGRVEAKCPLLLCRITQPSCNLHGACGGKARPRRRCRLPCRCNLHGACGGKGPRHRTNRHQWHTVAICTGRVEAKRHSVLLLMSSDVAICTGRVEAKRHRVVRVGVGVVAICTGRVEAKAECLFGNPLAPRCNLHGACGGKDVTRLMFQSAKTLQSARGVWRQRVNTSMPSQPVICCNLHGACGGKEASRHVRRCRCGVAICTGRVEAKVHDFDCFQHVCTVAICTGRVEAKRTAEKRTWHDTGCNLHGACGGKVENAQKELDKKKVAICTGRVEAKTVDVAGRRYGISCNLHGACGGKVGICLLFFGYTRCNLHGACGGKENSRRYCRCPCALQSARGVWRQRVFER